MMCERGWTVAGARAEPEPEVNRSSSGAPASTGQGFTKMILSKLRRHTSLEGASPYLRMKTWRLDRCQRAASLDMRGSPKRRAFQRQRAASETLDHEEAESHAVGGDFLCSLAPPLFPETASSPRRLSAGSLPSPTLGRLEVEAVMELNSGAEPGLTPDLPVTLAVRSHPMGEENGLDVEEEELEEEEEEEEGEEEGAVGVSGGGAAGGGAVGDGVRGWGGPGALLRRRMEGGMDGGSTGGEAAEPTPYRDIWSLRASLEQYASSDLSSNDRDSTRSDADSLSSLGGAGKAGGSSAAGPAGAGATGMFQSQDIDEELPYDEPPATTKVKEEEEEAEEEEEEEGHGERRRRGGRGGSGGGSVDSERGGSDGESAGRKLLQMDSGYASMDAPPLVGGVGGGGGKTASERRRYFTCAGRKGTVCESFEARLLQEESDETEMEPELEENHAGVEPEKLTLVAAVPAAVIPKEPRSSPIVKSPLAQKPRLFRRRDYSIDERTEALFNEFLRHDPRLDPRPHHHHHSRSARSSRLHLRAQWQRAKQHSDPGGSATTATARLSPSLERLRWGPLRRGESAGYPLDASTPTTTTRYHLHHHHHLHGPLPRIASAADEENSEGGEEGTEEPKTASGSVEEQEKVEVEEEEKVEDNCSNNNSSSSTSTSSSSSSSSGVQTSGLHPEQRGEDRGDIGALSALLTPDLEHCGTLEDPGSLAADKIAANLEERLYGGLRRTHRIQEQTVVVVARTSPDDTTE